MKKIKKKDISNCTDIELSSCNNEDSESSVYLFYNTKHNLHLFINAFNFDEAMDKFDLCSFKDRPSWKIFLECGHQPSNALKGKK